MRLTLLALTISSVALLSGCATQGSECVWTSDVMFGSEESVAWLSANDEELLRSVVEHNEKRQEFCR